MITVPRGISAGGVKRGAKKKNCVVGSRGGGGGIMGGNCEELGGVGF